MTMLKMFGAGLALAAALTMSGCGDDDSGDSGDDSGGGAAITADDLDGMYMSSSVTGQDLVEGSTVMVTFDSGTMAVSAGCNTMTSAYAVTDGTLAWTGDPAATRMACPDELMAQDDWLIQAFTDGFEAALDGDTLTLTAGEVTMELEPSQ